MEKVLFKEGPKIRLSQEQLKEIEILKKSIVNGEYDYEQILCSLCSNDTYTELSRFDRYGVPYKSNLCNTCGLVYTSPRFSQESYIKFYDLTYRKIYTKQNSNTVKEEFFENQIYTGKRILDFLNKHYQTKKIKSVLEVGCGMGGILKPFQDKGYIVKGIDYGSEYINIGKSKKLNLHVGDIKTVKESFDLIIYSHVFEHILHLGKELDEIKKRLNNDGLLYIAVPGILNLRSYRYKLSRYFQNAHTYNFSLITLKNILNKHGFDLIFGNEKVEAIFKYSGKKNSSISFHNDSERIMVYLKNLKHKHFTWYLTIYGIVELIKVFLRRLHLMHFIKRLKKYQV
jgi:2-polyprenyl-3-methyl-5-hydroxy-6-metoxy-1,4-benzoquinol methylase